LQHTATHRVALYHSAPHCPLCKILQRTAPRCTTRQHTATYCITLHHTVTKCNTATQGMRRVLVLGDSLVLSIGCVQVHLPSRPSPGTFARPRASIHTHTHTYTHMHTHICMNTRGLIHINFKRTHTYTHCFTERGHLNKPNGQISRMKQE